MVQFVSVYDKRLPSCIAAPRIAGGTNRSCFGFRWHDGVVITATVSSRP